MTQPATRPARPTVTRAQGANEDQLAANVVLALHRLTKQSTLYTSENEAQLRTLQQTQSSVMEYGRRTGRNPKVFFSDKSVFVGRQLLRAGRTVYEAALELGEILRKFGIDEMSVGFDVSVDELKAFQGALGDAIRKVGPPPQTVRFSRIRLKKGKPPGRRRFDDEDLAPKDVLVRDYCTAVVVVRRFLASLLAGRCELPSHVRRISEQLVDISERQAPAFLASTALYNVRNDQGGRAVNSALLALAMARQLTSEPRTLSRIAMAALLYDVGLPRLAGCGPTGEGHVGSVLPRISPDEEGKLPAASTVMTIALAGVSEASMVYSVLVYEALSLNYRDAAPKPYGGTHAPTLEARIVAIARLFIELLADPKEERTANEAMLGCLAGVREQADETTVRLLMTAIGIFPTGTLVELSTGHTAIVVEAPSDPRRFLFPTVRPVVDSQGGRVSDATPIDLSAAAEDGIRIVRVASLGERGQGLAAARGVSARRLSQQNLHDADDEPPRREGRHTSPRAGADPRLASPAVPLPRAERPTVERTPMPEAAIEAAPLVPAVPASAAVPAMPARADEPAVPAPAEPQRDSFDDRFDAALRDADAALDEESCDGEALEPDEPMYAVVEPEIDAAAQAARAHAIVASLSQRGRFTSEPHFDVGDVASVSRDSGEGAGSELGEPEDALAEAADDAATVMFAGDSEAASASSSPEDVHADASPSPSPAAIEAPPAEESVRDWFRQRTAGLKPAAQGTFERTPLLHLLVYALDQRLTGTTVFLTHDGNIALIYFEGGAPAKVRTSELVSPLGQVLIELGALDSATTEQTLKAAMSSRRLHGELLTSHGLVRGDMLVAALRWQVVRKIEHLLTLPKSTRYAYFPGQNLLDGYGGADLVPVEPLALVMSGCRRAGITELALATLEDLEDAPLGIHPAAELERLGCEPHERAIIDLIRERGLSFPALVASALAPAPSVKVAVYALVILRVIYIDTDAKPPVGCANAPHAPLEPPRDRAPSNVTTPTRGAVPQRTAKPPHGQPAPAAPTPSAPQATPLTAASAPGRGPAPPRPSGAGAASPPVPAAPAAPAEEPAPPSSRRGAAAPAQQRETIEARFLELEQLTYFQLLGIDAQTVTSAVQGVYFAQAKLWHPDRLSPELHDLRPKVARIFARLTEAFQTLSDPHRRQAYVESLAVGGGQRELLDRAVDSAILFQKAEVLFKKGMAQQAETMMAQAVDADPQPEYLSLLAWIQSQRISFPAPADKQTSPLLNAQIAMLDRAITAAPSYERAIYYRAELHKRAGFHDKAFRDYKKTVELNPRNIDAARELRIYEKRRDKGQPGLFGRLFKKGE